MDLLFAGAGAIIAHWGLGVGLIIICLFLAFGTQLLAGIPLIGTVLADLFAPLRKDLLWLAAAIALALFVYSVGVHDEAARCVAKTEVIKQKVDKAVDKATDKAKSGTKDPWDSPEN